MKVLVVFKHTVTHVVVCLCCRPAFFQGLLNHCQAAVAAGAEAIRSEHTVGVQKQVK